MLEKLKPYISKKNGEYTNKLIPNAKPCLGVYTKNLKSIAKDMVLENRYDFLNEEHKYHDEDMVHVLMITYIKDYDLMLKHLKNVIPMLSNWAMVDQLVCNLKIVKKHKTDILKLLDEYKYSNNEYEVRFVLIMLLAYYCEEEYLEYIFNTIEQSYKDAYYIKMGMAWLLCDCMIKHREATMNYLKKCSIDSWTYNKAIQKMIESYRISDDDKIMLRKMKKWVVNDYDEIR